MMPVRAVNSLSRASFDDKATDSFLFRSMLNNRFFFIWRYSLTSVKLTALYIDIQQTQNRVRSERNKCDDVI